MFLRLCHTKHQIQKEELRCITTEGEGLCFSVTSWALKPIFQAKPAGREIHHRFIMEDSQSMEDMKNKKEMADLAGLMFRKKNHYSGLWPQVTVRLGAASRAVWRG